MKCKLCEAQKDKRVILYENKLVYSIMALYPYTEGNVLVLPKRHTTTERLTLGELFELNLACIKMKDKLAEIYPDRPPFLLSHFDKGHSSIKDHMHYHIIPNATCVRDLINYNNGNGCQGKGERSKLEKIANTLRIK